MIQLGKEYMIEFSNDGGIVYLSVKDDDGFWFEIGCDTELTSAEDFAYGMQVALEQSGNRVEIENLDVIDPELFKD